MEARTLDAPLADPGPGLDPEAGLQFVGGEPERYRTVLARFLDLRGGADREIRAALASGDGQEARRSAHGMVAVAGTIGAPRLSDLALALEQALEAGTTPGPALAAFEAELARVVEEARRFLSA